MQDKQKTDNTGRKPYVQVPDQIEKNPNPRANENIAVSTSEQQIQNKEPSHGVGSEITDGEDA
jgi:hypothetical protein